ncbi:sensor histidine kinase [Virgibacillus xinjiangensis]|uniref:histidine kinase n=1 Tax=Virgibacillus xinjiangensis TaxID=393090 RepID=A0ABV7CSR5_9BACI
MSERRNNWIPGRFLLRLTLLNIVIVTLFILISGFGIYQTACFLIDRMGVMNDETQRSYNAALLQYFWYFAGAAILTGTVSHYYFTKRLIRPLREVIESTRKMKDGENPTSISVKGGDELSQLVIDFNHLVQDLKKNQQYQQKMVADISHEFRTPLANLNGYLNALRSGVITGDQQLYQSLAEESARLTGLVEQLEDLQKWDGVKETFYSNKSRTEISQLIEQTAAMFRCSLEKKDIPLITDMKKEYVHVEANGIAQVLSNLIDNAINYHVGDGPIQVKGEVVEGVYKVSVMGRGDPIPPDQCEAIFERFHRLDPSRGRERGGSGLGLAIAKGIIRSHGGEIGVESETDLHTFWFTLPLENQEKKKE